MVRVPAGPLKKEAPPGATRSRPRPRRWSSAGPEAALRSVRPRTRPATAATAPVAAADGAFDRAGGDRGRAGGTPASPIPGVAGGRRACARRKPVPARPVAAFPSPLARRPSPRNHAVAWTTHLGINAAELRAKAAVC